MSKLTQLKKLQKNEDMGLAYLADEAYKLLKNPMILFDTDMKVLAYKENDTPFWNNFINEEMIKGDIIKSYIKNGSHEDIISPMRVVLFMYNEEINHNIIFGKIYDKNNLPIACLVVVPIYNSFEDTDLALVTSLCKMFSFEICKIPYYQNYSQTKLETYISKLITNGIGEKAYADGFVEMIYKGLKNRLYLAVADISQINPTFDRLAYYKELFMQTQSTFRYAIHSNYIVIIMSTNESVETFNPKTCLNRLNKIIRQDHIKVGISNGFENLYELSKYYEEAIKALKEGEAKDENIFIYTE